MEKLLFTSESVTEGHPDKICDAISDAILDALMEQDPMSRVACETCTTTGIVMVMGEISTKAYVDIQKIVRDTVREIGYTRGKYGFDADTCGVITTIDEQSSDIAMGVDKALEAKENNMTDEEIDAIGAGDQGMMFGFATNETEEYMPYPISLAHKLSRQLTKVRKDGTLSYLRPDGKTQVTVEYDDGKPSRLDAVVLSTQHDPDITQEQIHEDIKREVFDKILPADMVDDETKWIIEKIFSLAYQGYGSAKITKQLRAEKVPTASWLNFTRYGTFAHIFEGKPESKRYEWTIAHVKAILKSEVYIGNSVHNMQSTVSFKSKKKVRKPESEWFRVENTHEPIIDKEVFYRVQEQIKSRRRQTKEKATPIFAGLVKCADCGWSMRFGTNKTNKTPYSYYACSYYGQFGKGNCSMHYIRYDVLYQAVLERLQYWAKAVQQDEEKVLNKIQKAGNAERIREKKKKASALKKAENRQNEIDRLFAKMYEDRACEKITERNFVMLSSKYQKEQIELEQQITSLREELSKMEQDMIGAEKWIELIKEYSVPKELTAPLLNAMIEKILIHEATTNEDNERIQEIEIYYRFIGKVD